MSRVQDPQELAHELFVYYLINGLIIPIPNQENINKIASYLKENPENTLLHIETLFKKIESIFYKSLERIKGSIITD
jgi:precorrin-6B methylase 1